MAWFSHLSLLLAQAGLQTETIGSELSVGQKMAIVVLILVGSFGGGSLLSKWLRMPDYSFKIGLILATFISGIVIDVLGWPPKLGIDLSGGVVLVYEVDQEQMQDANRAQVLDNVSQQLRSVEGHAIKPRPNASGQIEIPLPDKDLAEKVEQRINQLIEKGVGLSPVGPRVVDGAPVLVYDLVRQPGRVDMANLITAVSKRINPSGVKEVTVRLYGTEQLEVIVPETEEREVDQIKKLISTSGNLQFRILANQHDHKDLIELAQQTPSNDVYQGGKLKARWVDTREGFDPTGGVVREMKDGKPQVLIMIDDYNVDGRYLTSSSSGIDAERGNPCINFSFNSQGSAKFGQLTSENSPDPATGARRELGIVLDNVLQSAAYIRTTITDHGQITGDFNEDYVNFVVGVLNAGSLPAALNKEPISQQRISAQLGGDTIRSGAKAMILSTVAVVVFMLVYYRFAGAVADVAVIMNMVLAVALMIMIKAAFTLPGLAGLVLTVGMAVDANVLIYERIREESSRGASLRMAIRNGFSRAMSTIIDSNLTTVSTAVVLYMIGTDQIKGFAVSLILGLIVSLYTAVFVARVIFDIFERQRWITRLKMMQFIGETHIDFVRWRGPAIAFSLVLIAIGMAAVAVRGKDLFDIDFTGGTSVQVLFDKDKPQDIADVRKLVSNVEELPDVAVSAVGDKDLEYKIDTSQADLEKVQQILKEKFGDSLATYSMTYDEIAAVEPAKATSSEKDSPSKKDTKKDTPTEDKSKKGASLLHPFADSTALALAGPGTDETSELILAQATQDDTKKKDKPSKEAAEESSIEAPGGSVGEMTSGTEVQLHFAQKINHPTLTKLLEEELQAVNLPAVRLELSNPEFKSGSTHGYSDWKLSIMLSQDDTKKLLDHAQSRMAETPVFPSANRIGGKVAGETQLYALYALLASLVMIVIYVWVRFQNVMFGLAAVLALVHDVIMTVGFLALSKYLAPYFGFLLIDDFKISLAVVAALLTIVGYSINDTIVIFDRIREVRGKNPDLTVKMINDSVNQTLSRTLITSGTVVIGTMILYFVGGVAIHPFAYAMLIGLFSGTYSTVYIASPVLLWLKKPLAQTGFTPAKQASASR